MSTNPTAQSGTTGADTQETATVETNEAAVVDTTNIDKIIEQSLAQLKPYDAQIQVIRTEAFGLKLADPSDSKTYKAISEKRKEIKRTRVGIDKVREQLNENALRHQRAVNGEAQRIMGQLKEAEGYLSEQEEIHEKWKEEEKARQEREEMERINRRNTTLIDMGLAFNGVGYSIGEFSISAMDVADISEEAFAGVLERVKPIVEEERQKKEAEAQRKQEEAAELQRQKQELEKQKAELELQRKEQEQEREKQRLQEIESRKSTRHSYLTGLGFTLQGSKYCNGSVELPASWLAESDETEWAVSMDGVSEALTKQREEIAERERQKKEDERVAELKQRQQELNDVRVEILRTIGCRQQGNILIAGETTHIGMDTLHELSPEQWDELLTKAKASIKAKQEADAKRTMVNNRKLDLINAGMKDMPSGFFEIKYISQYFEDNKAWYQVADSVLETATDEEWNQIVRDAFKNNALVLQYKEADDAREAEIEEKRQQEQIEATKSDLERIKDFKVYIETLPVPDLRSDDGKRLLEGINKRLKDLCEYMTDFIENV